MLFDVLLVLIFIYVCFFFQAEDGIRDLVRSRGLGDVYKRQSQMLAESGHFYVMHRFDLDAVAFARRMRDRGLYLSLIHI